jgi:threonine/homoserine/homoserine lactone efflux protein
MSLMFAMLMFSLTMSISPGPVNMVIISSEAMGLEKRCLLSLAQPSGLLYYLSSSALGSIPVIIEDA